MKALRKIMCWLGWHKWTYIAVVGSVSVRLDKYYKCKYCDMRKLEEC